MHWSFFVCFWFIHDLATLHSTCCIQQRLVESWTLTKRICLMMKPSSLVVHDDIFILNLVPPIVNYPKRSRFLRTLCFCKTNQIARSICNLMINHFWNDSIDPLVNRINWSNCSVVLKVLHCLIIRMGAVYVKLDVGVEILWKLIETMLNAVVCCLQGGSNHFFHFENFEILNFLKWRCQFDKL